MICSTVKNDVFISSECQTRFFSLHARLDALFFSVCLPCCLFIDEKKLKVEPYSQSYSFSREKERVSNAGRIIFHMRENKEIEDDDYHGKHT